MAQSALKTCEICMGGSSTDFCLECEQYFCMNCKGLHKRQKGTQNHEFQSAENVVSEVKSRCNDHKEDCVFVCENCDISICMRCITGKHNGHTVSNMKEYISELRTTFRKQLDTKMGVIQTSQKQVETDLTTLDLSVTSVINEIKEEGSNIKEMVDRHIEKMIAILRQKAQHEKESYTKTLVDYKQHLEKTMEIEKRENKISQSRDDASTIQHLKTLNDELSKLSVVPLPDPPAIKYSPKKVTDSDIDQLIGTYSLSTTQTKKADSPAAGTTQTKKADSPAATTTQTKKADSPTATTTQTKKADSPAATTTQTKKADSPAATEVSIVSARANVMLYDDLNKKWSPAGNSQQPSLSKVQIYRHTGNNTFRVVGRKMANHDVVINRYISRKWKYNQTTATFHQWRDQRQLYGLYFVEKEDAESFAEAVKSAIDTLNSTGETE